MLWNFRRYSLHDLAEWGVVIDDKQQVQQMMDEYWNPMWEVSYRGIDVDVQAVLDGLEVDRSAPKSSDLSEEERRKMESQKFRYNVIAPGNNSEYYEKVDPV